MWKLVLALLLVTVAVGQAAAGVTSIKCSGQEFLQPDNVELDFTVDSAGKVSSVSVEGIRKITTLENDEQHIRFQADTAHLRYTLSFGPRTKNVAFYTMEIDSNGQANQKTVKSYLGSCTKTP